MLIVAKRWCLLRKGVHHLGYLIFISLAWLPQYGSPRLPDTSKVVPCIMPLTWWISLCGSLLSQFRKLAWACWVWKTAFDNHDNLKGTSSRLMSLQMFLWHWSCWFWHKNQLEHVQNESIFFGQNWMKFYFLEKHLGETFINGNKARL